MGSYFFEYIIKISIGSLEFTINWILSKFLNKKYFYLKITCFCIIKLTYIVWLLKSLCLFKKMIFVL